ncbi:hypothetical protein [Ancrocorticia populi]|uniref:Uncharacterized protein n=1 Tax=Ancrocorticia populi TaxID=2175228 RepID=A0A2V1K6B3_9ACTO|nr:hypothetical protein [Ancrocorticia populi]MDN6487310.1 hypothetical protein [Ancrocorticia sp.]PWF26988.1 hypothetical protein DD236_00800 [Ancrocorticia populi]
MAKTAALTAAVGLVLAGAVGPIVGTVDTAVTDTRSPVSVTEAQIRPMFLCSWFPYLRPLCKG